MAIPAPSNGQIFGHYRLVEEIGAGGMGVVYRAYDERLHRYVALKIVPEGAFSDENARRQFRNEALAVGKLNHPNIAMAFDFGHESGVDYLVTEYVEGLNLDEKIADQPLPEKQVLELGIQLASGLEAAHRAGVIHRDLKPANLRLTPEGQLKVLDFGLAQQTLPVDETEETINALDEPAMSGTVPYMAPELLRGEIADARSDIWAAGAVLYEMAAGKRAFPDRQHTLLIDAILHYDPVRPRLLHSQISSSLEAVILKALDRDPERRYQSARELRVDLARLVAGENVTDSIHPAAAAEVAARKRRSKVLLPLLGVLALGVVVGYLIKQLRPAVNEPQRILAVLPFDSVGQDPATSALGAGLAETLTAKLVQASDNDSIQVVSPRDLRDQGVKTVEDARREFGTDLVLESSLQRQGNDIRINCSLVNSKTHRQMAARTISGDASDPFALQDRVVNEVLDMLPAKLNAAERRKLYVRPDTKPAAYEAYIRGRGYLQEYEKPENIDGAIAEFDKALEIDPNYAAAYAGIGEAYLTGFQQFPKDKAWVLKAATKCEKALSLSSDLVEGHVCLGNYYNQTGNYEKAAAEFQEALHSDPNNADALRGFADAHTKLGDFSLAETAYKNAIALRPKYWGTYSWLGNFYFNQGRYTDAAEMFRKSTELSPDNYHGYFNLGGTYALEGHYGEAVAALSRSIELRPTPDAYGNLGYTYTLMHRYPEAIEAFQAALKLDERDWLNWGNLGDALYWSPGRRTEAVANYAKAISLARSKLEVNPKDDYILAYLADYSAMTDDRTAALDYLQRALTQAPNNGEVLFRGAIVYNHFGDTDKTLFYLKKAAAAGYSRIVIKVTPDFQSLQQNQEFRALAESSH